MRKVLGLDIGITSVGWGIIDLDDDQFRDCGVRLFTEADASNNANRRALRSARRLKSRRKNRKDDLLTILKSAELIGEDFKPLENPYEIRCKGLKEKLNNQEFATALLHICKRRGSALDVVEDDEVKIKENETVKSTLHNNDLLIRNGKRVCEIQLEALLRNGKIRGAENNFRSSQYELELADLLSVQKIDKPLAEAINDIIFRRRHFSEGPGSFSSPTPYGRFYLEDGEVKEINLIEKMRGRCSIFPEELRAPKYSYSAERFNLLNDLNNLSCFGEKMDLEQKQQVLDIAQQKGKVTPKEVAKIWGVNLEDIAGFRVDKSEKPLLSEMVGYKSIRKVLHEHDYDALVDNGEWIDSVTEILTHTKIVKERVDAIKKRNPEMSEKCIEELAKLSRMSGYHSLSLKAIRLLNEELLQTNFNQMQIIHMSGLNMHRINIQKKGSKIVFDEQAVLSPVAKQAHREAIKVVNHLRRKYGEFYSIVVETTRSKNSKEQKEQIKNTQKFFEEQNKQVQSISGNAFQKLNAKQKLKIRLYQQQDGKCLYTGEALNLNRIIQDPTMYEIDHIIPISISLDDSINNKVLCTNTANRNKSNLTPYRAFHAQKFGAYTYQQFKAHVLSLTNQLGRKKVGYLLLEEDITKIEVQKGFVARNLVDTSYANRLVLNTLQEYFKINQIETKVFTVKGSATSSYRGRIGNKKMRDLHFGHHAVDALLIACIQKQGVLSKQLDNYQVLNNELVVNPTTGEVVEGVDVDAFLSNRFIEYVRQVANVPLSEIKFSHKVDRKVNRQIADQTIYSTRTYGDDELVVKKYKNIYDKQFTTFSDDISLMLSNEKPNACDKYQMYKHDPQTFQKFVEIVRNYEENHGSLKGKKVNPFYEHLETHGEYITKYSKKDNGPVVTQIKYTDGKLGNHIDLSHNYESKGKKVVLQQISPFRTDFYMTDQGYKFVTVRYCNIRYKGDRDAFVIDEEWYHSQKQEKGIKKTDSFLFSLHRNEVLGIKNKNAVLSQSFDADLDKALQEHVQLSIENFANGLEMVKFTATNNDKTNQIEIKPIPFYEKKRLMPTIGKSTEKLVKYHVSPIGEMSEITTEVLKLEL